MINPKNVIRGSVWFVNLDPTIGHEQAKNRPCLVVSADSYNQGDSGLVVIIPITSRKRELFWIVPMQAHETNLEKESYIICDQIRTVSLQRFTSKCLGIASDFTMKHVEKRLKILLYSISHFSED